MTISYDLTQLDPYSFENMVNFLAMKVLGNGTTGFSPGSDGGRDGYYLGEAPYPSEKTRWAGCWYIQSKFHKPHLSANSQKWLITQVKNEIASFKNAQTSRLVPDIWIIATNIDPSGAPETGAFDQIQKLVKAELGGNIKFDIWGGRKILDFLAGHPVAASYFGHFLTPGNVLTSLYEQINDVSSQVKNIIEHLVVSQFNDQLYTKLEQAGSSSDNRPKLYELFVDLPFVYSDLGVASEILEALVSSAANTHKVSAWSFDTGNWKDWRKVTKRSRVIVLKGGPGQGKSTVGQYFSQIQRAALILGGEEVFVSNSTREVAEQFKVAAIKQGFWTETPRIPITIELKDFAAWYGNRSEDKPRGVLSYICDVISLKTEQLVLPGTMKRALALRSWFVNFDGLDEVPNDVKDRVADEINKFTDEMLPIIDADVLTLCTTRPQGYSGQLDKLDASIAILSALSPDTALSCASAVVRFDRTSTEADYSVEVLKSAMHSHQVLELMTTPLQSHIMAVVVRDGGRPPEKRWELFDNFYKVMKKRESQKNFQDARISKLLREDDTLLKAIHTRLGVVLHVLSEESGGAETTLDKEEFRALAHKTTSVLIDENVEDVVDALMEATTERLVFVNTPESSSTVRFDVRQLQEFFAGEFIYSEVSPEEMCARMESICTDSHWREVMHFSLSALVFNGRRTELAVASKVLTSADSAGNCHHEVLFSKRMAVGALLGLRLLNEGVLEQDKRLRQIFTEVIVPIYALPDSIILNLIIEKKHINSQGWLLNAMIDHLFNSSEGEGVGAALALICVLPDEHVRKNEVADRLLNASESYLKFLYNVFFKLPHSRARLVSPRFNERSPARWFLVETLRVLLSDEIRLGFDYIGAINIIRGNAYSLINTDFFKCLTVSETKLLFVLLDIPVVIEGTQVRSPGHRGRTNYKGLIFDEYEFDWRNEKVPEMFDFEVSPLDKISPLLQLIQAVIQFSKVRTLQSFCYLSELVKPFGAITKVLPGSLVAFIPLSTWRGNCEEQMHVLKNLSNVEFDRLMTTGFLRDSFLPNPLRTLTIDGDYSNSSWKNICRDYPVLAIDVWIQEIGIRDGNYLKPEFVAPFVKLVESIPEQMGNYILQWGKFFQYFPDGGQRLRQLLREARFCNGRDTLLHADITPFKVDLNAELNWLPMFANSFVAKVSFGETLQPSRYYSGSGEYSEKSLGEFGITVEDLEKIFLDVSVSVDLRRAALAMFLAMNFTVNQDYESYFLKNNINEVFRSLVCKDAPIWLVKSLMIFAEKYLRYDDSMVRKLIGFCFYVFRENYPVQLQMQRLMHSWRERSNAPVRTKMLLQPWLDGKA